MIAFKYFFVVLLLVTGLTGCAKPVDTTELDQEITKVQGQLDTARGELSLYGGGAILVMIQMQVKVLETTLAMLEQKRASWLMIIPLKYEVKNGELCESSLVNMEGIDADISSTTAEMDAAQAKADMYRSGLIKSMALVEVATHRMTLASLNQRQMMAKWQIPLFPQSSIGTSEGSAADEAGPAGPVVSDAEAI